jgi:hypothetical protein
MTYQAHLGAPQETLTRFDVCSQEKKAAQLAALDAQYQAKIMAEVERYQALAQEKEALNGKWDEQNATLVEAHEKARTCHMPCDRLRALVICNGLRVLVICRAIACTFACRSRQRGCVGCSCAPHHAIAEREYVHTFGITASTDVAVLSVTVRPHCQMHVFESTDLSNS